MTKLNKKIGMGLMNLHDSFLNASLIKKLMNEHPIKNDAEIFLISDRGRLERLWVGLLAVIIESWHSHQMKPVVSYIKTKVDTKELVQTLRVGRKDGSIDKMIQTRHYMFHRDNREYWDIGRFGPCGNLSYHLKIHDCFSKVLLSAMKTSMKV